MSSKRLSQTEYQTIEDLFNQGVPARQIGSQVGIHEASAIRILKKMGYDPIFLKRTPPTLVPQIIADYQANISSEIIAKKYNISSSSVRRVLKKNNIPIRPATQNKRQYDIKQDYFEKIDNEKNAYYLGLLYADGSLSSRGNGISLALHYQDVNTVKRFSREIYGFEKLHKSAILKDGGIAWGANIYCQKMHQDLTNLGCTPQKSLTLTFPNFLSADLLPHFVRGFMDGDGCICINAEKKPVVDFTSTKMFIADLITHLNTIPGVKCNKMGKLHENGITTNAQIGGLNSVVPLLNYLYANATVFMERKHEKYLEILELDKQRSKKKLAKIDDAELYATTYIVSHNGNQLNNKYLETLASEEKKEIAKELLPFYRENGFPYSIYSEDQLLKDFAALQNANISKYLTDKTIPIFNTSGLSIFKHFAPHFYETKSVRSNKPSMLEAFENDDLLLKVLENRMEQNFSMSGNMIKQGLYASKTAYRASVFFPVVAKTIYSAFTKEGDIVYDYSMGFGQRLLGALAVAHSLKYVGVDPLEKSVNGNKQIFDFFAGKSLLKDKVVELYCTGSEEFCPDELIGKVRMAFSSPPYFNLEIYSDNAKQAYHDGAYASFMWKWWKKVAQNTYKMLKTDGIFALNIAEKMNKFDIKTDMSNVLLDNGFKLIDEYKIQLTRNTVFNNQNGKHKYEPILIFQKLAQ